MDLREVADELYALPTAEFTASRNAAAGKAGSPLAAEIRGLRKPSASAAAVNALVREHPDVVDAILEVGDRMREAFAERDRAAIRELTGERQRLLQKATRTAGAASAGVLREVEDTLQAAVIDAAAAAAVRSGLLVRSLESTGVDQVDVSDAVALPIDVDAPPPVRAKRASGTSTAASASASASAEPAESPSERRERERRIRTAEKALERARTDADALDDELDEEVDRRTDLEAERDALARRLERTQDELAESRAAERELRRRITQAQSALRDAEKALRAARD
ncbi:hypothetical protein ASE16_16365 [Leifsonia sp. Root227]|uniref:hypothetical protein n=1 Tax=Leifsonia sp. Root227 TaxID=1736496 RepID=UPI0006FEDFD1|nr:hypothetical protein [Leifsonia sp. Root227]KRC46959.1 hypothetical protein ASE16_16365 [Leifsonia sp. Root227]